MGNETSSPTKGHVVSPQVDHQNDLPFRYSSVSTDKSTNQASRKKAGPASPNPDPRNNMILVNSNKKSRKPDKALEALEKIPKFLPILTGHLGSGQQAQDNVTIDHRQLICICNRYQDHLHNTAHTINTRQDKINERIRWVAKNASARATRFGKIAQSIQKSSEKVIEIPKVQNRIKKIDDTIKYVLLPRMQELNMALPYEHRLEPFKFSFEATQFSDIDLTRQSSAEDSVPVQTEEAKTEPAAPKHDEALQNILPHDDPDPDGSYIVARLEAESDSTWRSFEELSNRMDRLKQRTKTLSGKLKL